MTAKPPLNSFRLSSRRYKKSQDAHKPSFEKMLETGSIEDVMNALTDKQQRFIEEYLIDYNGSGAVQRAGYNTKFPDRLAYEMLQHPGIRAVIAHIAAERAAESEIQPDYVIKKVVKTIEKAEANNNPTAVLRGCELLARHLGMFIERTEISGPNGDAIKYEKVKSAADAFTSAISGLIEREGSGSVPLIVERRDESGA